MNANKIIKITTPKQFDLLVELMEEHPHLGRGYSSNVNKIDVKDEWKKIATKLNVLGPPVRDSVGWVKVWSDFKFKVKKKLIQNKTECRATGGGIYKQVALTPTEEAASKLLQLDTIINPNGPSFGIQPKGTSIQPENLIPDANSSIYEVEEEITDQPSTSMFVCKRTPNKKTAEKNKTVLLEQQVNIQTELYTEVRKSLKEIERYSKKTYKLKEEKLNIYKRELRKKEEHRKKMLNLRAEEIEIKRRKIDLEELKSSLHL